MNIDKYTEGIILRELSSEDTIFALAIFAIEYIEKTDK